MIEPLWKRVWSLLKKLKVELPYDLSVPLLGICLKKSKTHSLMDSVGEGEGGKIWENGIETCKISCMK